VPTPSNKLIVFYSWQSDTPANLNRSFVEKALGAAIERLHADVTLEPVLRDAAVQIDKDTKGVGDRRRSRRPFSIKSKIARHSSLT
jgi:hypothetical protein